MSDIPEVSKTVEKNELGIVYHKLDISIIREKILAYDVRDYDRKSKKYYKNNNPEYLFNKLLSRLNDGA